MCLWLQQHPRQEIEVGLTLGGLSRLVRDLGVLMDLGGASAKRELCVFAGEEAVISVPIQFS